jgi:hypothetical protein
MRLRKVILAVAVLVLVATAVALASNRAPRGTVASPARMAPTPKPTAAQRLRLQHRLAAARARAGRRARATAIDVSRDFAVFRRPGSATDASPDSRAGDISRRVRNASDPLDQQTAASRNVFLVQRHSDLCVVVEGGAACGPTAMSATTPPLVAIVASDRSHETLWGAAPDGVSIVTIVSTTGQSYSLKPENNAYAADIRGVVSTTRMTYSDGTSYTLSG